MSGPRKSWRIRERHVRPIRAFWLEDQAEADAAERGNCLIMMAPHVDVICSVPAERSDADVWATLADILPPPLLTPSQLVMVQA